MTDKPSWQDAVSRLAVSHEVDEVKRLIEVLVREFKTAVYATALRYSRGDEQLAADIFQETFVRLLESRSNVRSPVAFPRFLKVVTMNVARDMLRRRASEAAQLEEIDWFEQEREDRLLETRLYLQAYLDQLKPEQVEVLTSKFFTGEPDQVVADRMGESVENIRVIRHRALGDLRKLINYEEL